MTTWKQEIYGIVRPAMEQRMFLFKEDSQTAWEHAYQNFLLSQQAATTQLLSQLITCPRLANEDELFESETSTVLDEAADFNDEEEI